jgi:hypothetical protein
MIEMVFKLKNSNALTVLSFTLTLLNTHKHTQANFLSENEAIIE